MLEFSLKSFKISVMRSVIWIVTFLVVFTLGIGFGVWMDHGNEMPHPTHAPAISKISRPAQQYVLNHEKWQEYQKVRTNVLHDNPALSDEYRALLRDINDQEQRMEAAMIKADPAVAPALAKLDRLRHGGRSTINSIPTSAH